MSCKLKLCRKEQPAACSDKLSSQIFFRHFTLFSGAKYFAQSVENDASVSSSASVSVSVSGSASVSGSSTGASLSLRVSGSVSRGFGGRENYGFHNKIRHRRGRGNLLCRGFGEGKCRPPLDSKHQSHQHQGI